MQIGKSLITLIATASVWQVLCSSGITNSVVVASPVEAGRALIAMWESGFLQRDTIASLGRVLLAVAIASTIAIPFGLLLALVPSLKQLFRPLIDFLRTIPPIAIFPPLVVAFGPFDLARVLTAAFGAALVMGLVIATTSVGLNSPRARFYKAQGSPVFRIISGIVLLEAIPGIVTAIRAGTSLAFVFVIVTELFLGAEYGLGSRLQYAQVLGNMPDAYAAMVAIGFSGTLLNRAIDAVEKWTITVFGEVS